MARYSKVLLDFGEKFLMLKDFLGLSDAEILNFIKVPILKYDEELLAELKKIYEINPSEETKKLLDKLARYETIENYFSIVKNIINARKMYNISMKDLANISGVSYSTIRRIEEFKGLPNMIDWLKICAALGIDVNCVIK